MAAAMDGTVISVKDDVMLGKTVTIQTAEGLNTVYGNLLRTCPSHPATR